MYKYQITTQTSMSCVYPFVKPCTFEPLQGSQSPKVMYLPYGHALLGHSLQDNHCKKLWYQYSADVHDIVFSKPFMLVSILLRCLLLSTSFRILTVQ